MADVIYNSLNIGLVHYLMLAFFLFVIALFGVVIVRNTIKLLILIEVMLCAVSLNFIAFANYIDSDVRGMIFAIFIIASSAAQLAVGIAILFAIYRHKKTVDTETMNDLRG